MNKYCIVKIVTYIFFTVVCSSLSNNVSFASPLSANASSCSVQLSIYNNGSRYLASSSARIIRTSTGNTVGNAVTAGNGLVTVLYSAGADANVPAGSYNTAVTYVATATFNK